ncbi:MAG: hypothetical protein J6U45_09655 [Alistipes sp.]|nr:hypothetical protein [Alistipes sp.]
MGKNIEKKSYAENEPLEIPLEAVEGLMRSERWSEVKGDAEEANVAVNALLGELLERPSVGEQSIDIERLMLVTADDIIDKFLRTEPRRIVAEEGDVTEEIVSEPELDEDDEFVSDELAEVYLQQGLKDMAKETYRKLSLLNPEKSVYFAEIISKIDSNN